MSGGHFDYSQYRVQDIAEKIDELLEEVARPRPPQHLHKWMSTKKQTGEGSYSFDRWTYDTFHTCETVEETIKRAKNSDAFIVRGKHVYDAFDTWTDKQGKQHRCEYIFSPGEGMEYDEGYEETHYYGPDYMPETIEAFKRGRDILREAYIYAQRIDWLLCGDDGEETFHERLKEDLAQLKKDGDLRNID